MLPLRDVVVFPHMVIPLFVGRPKSIKALETAMEVGKAIVAQLNAEIAKALDSRDVQEKLAGVGCEPYKASPEQLAAVVQQLNAEINKALESKDTQEKLAGAGTEPYKGSPEQLATVVREDLPRWARIVKESGARID